MESSMASQTYLQSPTKKNKNQELSISPLESLRILSNRNKENTTKRRLDKGISLDVCGTGAKRQAVGLEHLPTASAITNFADKKKRSTSRRQFVIRVNCPGYRNARKDFLMNYCNFEIISYCICMEKSNNATTDFHLHAFLEFSEKIDVETVRLITSAINPAESFDVQPCKSKKSVLKYITKEDKSPYSNLRSSLFHFNYRVFKWANNAPVFRCTDDFVVEHRNYYKFLERYYYENKQNILRPFNGFNMNVNVHHGWPLLVAQWFRESCYKYEPKAKMLYLHGVSNTGKTTFIEELIGKQNMDFVFYPGSGKFAYQSLRCDFHKIILFEEFDWIYVVKSMLKRLLERRAFAAPVKGGIDIIQNFKGMIILVSNDPPLQDDAFLNRLYCVEADVPIQTLPACVLPKTEIPDFSQEDVPEEEILLISSDEELPTSPPWIQEDI